MSEKTYIGILIESLLEKLQVLDEVMACDREQMAIVRSEKPDLEALDRTIQRTGELAEKIERLNNGFESIYQKTRDELLNHKEEHRAEILRLQELVRQVTEKSVKVQTEQARNKNEVTGFLQGKRRELANRKKSVRAMNQYSNTMRKINRMESSVFLDSKK